MLNSARKSLRHRSEVTASLHSARALTTRTLAAMEEGGGHFGVQAVENGAFVSPYEGSFH